MELPACLYNCVSEFTFLAFSKSSSANPINRQHSFGVSFRIRNPSYNLRSLCIGSFSAGTSSCPLWLYKSRACGSPSFNSVFSKVFCKALLPTTTPCVSLLCIVCATLCPTLPLLVVLLGYVRFTESPSYASSYPLRFAFLIFR